MAVINWFDVEAVLNEVAKRTGMLPEETQAVKKRLGAMAARTVPPDWGYAGMLAEDKMIVSVFDVYARIAEWDRKPKRAERHFRNWNARRLAKNE